MDSGWLWAAIGSAAAVFTAGVGVWQLRLELAKRRDRLTARAGDDAFGSSMAGLPIAPPIGGLPRQVWGRETILAELRRHMSPRKGGVWVLAGMGGVGKSTVALAA